MSDAQPWQADHAFSFRGADVRYARLGQGPAVLCLHNAGTSSTIWRHLAPALADRREVFALDLPGFGASVEPALGLHLAENVELAASFIEERELAPVDVVGNCMGSAIALQLAAKHPKLVRSLVLFNPLSEATFRAGRLAAVQWIEQHAPFVLDAVGVVLRRIRIPAFAARALVRMQLGAAGKETHISADPPLMACYLRASPAFALRHLLADMGSFGAIDRLRPGPEFPPRCTIWGLQNPILSASAGRVLNQTLAPARQEWLSDCGHLPMLERPDACLEIVRQFLGSLPREARASTQPVSSAAVAAS